MESLTRRAQPCTQALCCPCNSAGESHGARYHGLSQSTTDDQSASGRAVLNQITQEHARVARDIIPTRQPVDHSRRELVKSATGLVLTASLGVLGAADALAASASEPGETTPPWGDPATLVSAIGAGTLAVPSVAESAEAYRKGIGYIEHWHRQIPKET